MSDLVGNPEDRFSHNEAKWIVDCFRLRERGHEVVGVEIGELPVKELFEENSIEYDVENFPNVGNLYTVRIFL